MEEVFRESKDINSLVFFLLLWHKHGEVTEISLQKFTAFSNRQHFNSTFLYFFPAKLFHIQLCGFNIILLYTPIILMLGDLNEGFTAFQIVPQSSSQSIVYLMNR